MDSKRQHILFVGQHALIREGMQQVIARLFPGALISKSADGDEALKQVVLGPPPTLIFLNPFKYHRSGLEVLSSKLATLPNPPRILVFSGFPMLADEVQKETGFTYQNLTCFGSREELEELLAKILIVPGSLDIHSNGNFFEQQNRL